ncbi:hypothetical protein [Anabaena sp. UHCC 0451]|uniref:hypothetical protein n=1 Tax=Anabaena sp. UHCC 0451 TaxID=2055235 RepID=UPI002B213AB9|nr:hypothetical protein [Anabaena sp. UHCC 0451]MEA5575846.1 hypothetical protein [Anabaena sp. UHCC 0451]
MRLPFILDVALGLIFIYLILSLLASEIQELIATLLQWRASHLRKSIEVFLSGNSQESEKPEVMKLVNAIYSNPLIKGINQEAKGFFSTLPRKFTWMVANMTNKIGNKMSTASPKTQSFGNEHSGPSYIAADTFAASLLEELKLPTIIHNITEARLEKVKNKHLQEVKTILTRSLKQIQNGELPNHITKDIKDDYENLRSDYTIIVNDFKNHTFDIDISVSRMKDSFDRYINNFQANLENGNVILVETCKRLESYRNHIFSSVEEAIIIEGLKPNINEIMTLMYTGSAVRDGLQTSLQNEDDPTYQTIKELVDSLPSAIKTNIVSIAKQAQYKARNTEEGLQILRREIEACFDSSMQRAGGVYKRNAKGVAILIGIALAFGANADTFHIIDRLSKDTVLRETIIYKAEQTIVQQSNSGNIKDLDTKQILEDLNLPIGWTKDNLQEQIYWNDPNTKKLPIIGLLTMFAGWITSGIAIAMGAPFWFDLLSKVMNVRNAGKSPKSSGD